MTRNDNPVQLRLEDVVALETRVWQALVDGAASADEDLLLPDFLGVYPTGFSDRAGHAEQLAHGPSIASYHLEQARVIAVGPDHVILSYLATFKRAKADASEQMYVSSLWARRDGRWRNLFSQDTPKA